VKRKTSTRLMYDRHTYNADVVAELRRPERMPSGFWRTLAEIMAIAMIAGVVIGIALRLLSGLHHVPPHR